MRTKATKRNTGTKKAKRPAKRKRNLSPALLVAAASGAGSYLGTKHGMKSRKNAKRKPARRKNLFGFGGDNSPKLKRSIFGRVKVPKAPPQPKRFRVFSRTRAEAQIRRYENYLANFDTKYDAARERGVLDSSGVKRVWDARRAQFVKAVDKAVDISKGAEGVRNPRCRSPRKTARKKNMFGWLRGGQPKAKRPAAKATPARAAAPKPAARAAKPASSPIAAEVASALVNLGYTRAWSKQRAAQVATPGRDFDSAMRAAMSKNPKPKKCARRNPNVKGDLDKAASFYKKFHGREAKQVIDYKRVIEDQTYTGLGKLVSFNLLDGRQITWEKSEQPMLAADPDGRQLYVIGGNQDLQMTGKRDWLDCGPIVQIEYFTQKSFDNFEPIIYFHKFGEDDERAGRKPRRPRLVYDAKAKQCHIVGGGYKIKGVGIVN